MDEQKRLENFLAALRDDRVKQGVDFALVSKYGQRCILCHEVWKERIISLAHEHGVTITEVFTFPG